MQLELRSLHPCTIHGSRHWHNKVDLRSTIQAVGSGSGVRQFNAGTTDFGASDKAVKDGNERPVVQIPMTGGAIVPPTTTLDVI